MRKSGRDRLWLGILALVLVMALVFAGACGRFGRGYDRHLGGLRLDGELAPEVERVRSCSRSPAPMAPRLPTRSSRSKAMQVTEGYGGMKSSTGRITPPALDQGRPAGGSVRGGGRPARRHGGQHHRQGRLRDDRVRRPAERGRLPHLRHGHGSREQGRRPAPGDHRLRKYDGQPVDPEGDGPLRLAIISPKKNQVTDGHWSVKWVTKLQVKPIEQDWTLALLRGR